MATKKIVDDSAAKMPAEETATNDWRANLEAAYETEKKNRVAEINKEYDKAFSQTRNNALKTGTVHGSYTNQILANLTGSQRVGDINKALSDVESQKLKAINDREQYEKQFAENQRQFNENLGLQREQFAEQKNQNAWNQNFQKSQFDWEKQYQQQQFNENKRQWNENFNYQKEQNAWNQNFQQQQFDWNKQYQQQQFEYQKGRDEIGDKQWLEQFDYSKKSSEQQYYLSWIQNIAANGGDPSDDILAKAGLSRADYDAAIKKAAAGGGGGGRSGTPDWKKYGFSSKEEYEAYLKNGGSNGGEFDPTQLAADAYTLSTDYIPTAIQKGLYNYASGGQSGVDKWFKLTNNVMNNLKGNG